MRKDILLAYWVVALTYLETLMRLANGGVFLTPSLYIGLVFNLSIILIFFSLTEWIGSKRIYLIMHFVFMMLCSLLFASQFVYFQLMRTYYSVYSAGNTGRALEFIDIAIKATRTHAGTVFLLLLPCIAMPLVLRGWLGFKRHKRLGFVLLGVGVALYLSGLLLIHVGDRSENSPYNVYYNMNYPEFSVNNIGLITTIRVDIKRILFSWSPSLESTDIDVTIETEPAIVEETTEKVVEVTPKPTTYNILTIDFEALKAQTKDKILMDMHDYFSSIEATEQNDMTGVYKDYNLVFITAEGFSHLAVREDVTPTLYKMMHQGIFFKEFYTPIWGVSTSDGEYVATTGLLPKSGVWSYRYSRNNHMPFAMGNQLKALGYDTKAYHNHTYTYYDRHLTHPNMGYAYKGIGNGLILEDTWPRSDLEMLEVSLPEYIHSERFHAYYMTVSGHMFYDVSGNQMAAKNYPLVKHLDYSEPVKEYLATQIELDRAMAYLLEALEESDKLDRTLIVISSDHYPYGLAHAEIEELNGGPVDKVFELYRNALIMYSGNMKPMVVEKPASSLDILPTLSNMMGIAYDSRLVMGKDIFSSASPLVVFNNQSFITGEGRYNTATKVFTKTGDADDETVLTHRNEVSQKISAMFYYSSKILEKNYYDEVLNDTNRKN
jgi:arylsulfatase A-like enzyme